MSTFKSRDANGIPLPSKPAVEIVSISPAIAKDMLKRNENNRRVSHTAIRRYAKMMKAGDWMLVPDAIAFDKKDGRLINGQHRLHAVVESGVTEQFIVVFGIHPDAFKAMDQGVKRSLSQALEIEGYSNSTRLSSATRLLYNFESGGSLNSAINTPDAIAYIDFHTPALPQAVAKTNALASDAKGIWRPSTFNFIYYAMQWRDEVKAWKFCSAVATGLGLKSKKDPRYALRQRLRKEAQKPGGRVDRTLEHALSIKAANKFFGGEEVTLLRWSPGAGQDFPELEVGDEYPFGFFDK